MWGWGGSWWESFVCARAAPIINRRATRWRRSSPRGAVLRDRGALQRRWIVPMLLAPPSRGHQAVRRRRRRAPGELGRRANQGGGGPSQDEVTRGHKPGGRRCTDSRRRRRGPSSRGGFGRCAQHPVLPRSRFLAGVSGRRSLSSSTPSGEGRLVRDASGRFVRSDTGGDRGDDGTGKKRVRNNNNANDGGGDGNRGGGREGDPRSQGGWSVGRGGGREDARVINASISIAACPRDTFLIVRDHHRELDHIHVSTAFNKLGNMAKTRDPSPRHLTHGRRRLPEAAGSRAWPRR